MLIKSQSEVRLHTLPPQPMCQTLLFDFSRVWFRDYLQGGTDVDDREVIIFDFVLRVQERVRSTLLPIDGPCAHVSSYLATLALPLEVSKLLRRDLWPAYSNCGPKSHSGLIYSFPLRSAFRPQRFGSKQFTANDVIV